MISEVISKRCPQIIYHEAIDSLGGCDGMRRIPSTPKGKILKKGYYRKGHKSYLKHSGKTINVKGSYVKPTYITDIGKHGPKTLPPLGNEIHLSDYGYSTKLSDEKRHAALLRAAQASDLLLVERRLNLARNYQAYPIPKEIMSRDVNFLKELYHKKRNKYGRNKKNYTNRKIEKNYSIGNYQIGGNNNSDSESSINSSDEIEKNIFLVEKNCNDNNCIIKSFIYEKHILNDGTKVLFYTLDKNDINDVLLLDKDCISENVNKDDIKQKLNNEPYLFIGIRINDELKGYCMFEEKNDIIEILWFCAKPSYSTPLYTFLEKFFSKNDYKEIYTEVRLGDINQEKKIKFWHQMGFSTLNKIEHENRLILHKNI